MIFLHAGENQNFFDNRKTEDSIAPSKQDFQFICKSQVMQGIYNKVKDLSRTSESVLILGAEGTGRSTVARQIFNETRLHSLKRNFVEFNLQGYSAHLIQQKLFGGDQEGGLLSMGNSNTLYIRGIELLNHRLQKQLISFLLDQKNKEILPRLICSSNDNFPKRVQDSYFFQDLFHLLSANLIILPLLHERPEDVPHFVEFFNKANQFKGRLNYAALNFLQSYRSHSNISELKKICLQISILYSDKDIITEKDLFYIVKDSGAPSFSIKYNPNISLEELTNLYIQKSLEYFKCKRSSAKALGISMKTIYNKIKSGDILPVLYK